MPSYPFNGRQDASIRFDSIVLNEETIVYRTAHEGQGLRMRRIHSNTYVNISMIGSPKGGTLKMLNMASWVETAKEVVGREFDEMLLHSAKIYSILRAQTRKEHIEQLRTWTSFYLSKSYHDHPDRFFSFPKDPPHAKVIEESAFSDGAFRVYSFHSSYTVRNPVVAQHFNGFEQNRTAYLAHWSHNDRGRNTIVCCHGWSLGEPRQAQRMFNIPRLYSMGLDVALFITPFHWRRAESLTQRVSPPFPFRDPVLGLEGLGQAMHDLHSSLLLLKAQGASRIGLIGASLGGYITALFVSLTKIADLATLVVPLISFHGLKVPQGPFTSGTKQAIEIQEKVSALWRIHSPLSHTCALPADCCLIIAAIGDRLCPFEDVLALYEHWGRPEHAFLRGGHALFFPRRARGQAWYGFLQRNNFV